MSTAQIIQIVAFILVSVGGFALAARSYMRIYRNIMMGRPEDLTDQPGKRTKKMLIFALGQKKMFKITSAAILHLAVYVAFLVTQIELLEIFVDGFSGQHRVFYHLFEGIAVLEGLYVGVINFIEILSVAALIATIIFLARRNLLKLPRFTMREMAGWPFKDANIILFIEIYLIACIFMMNGGDQVLHHSSEGKYYPFLLSRLIGPALFGGLDAGAVKIVERIGWWGHFLGVIAFLNYLPISKHLHILLAFPNAWFSRLDRPTGYMDSMDTVTKEIKLMMNPDTAFAAPEDGAEAEIPTFGAKDVDDLSWKNLLDAYTCTECGRCTSACPANQTGKLLSPRKIMMDVRDRMEEVGEARRANGGQPVDDGKSLISDEYISVEELRACTTCNACVEECPVLISPLDIIAQLRRNLILEQSQSPEEWNVMFSNIENNGAPWQFSQQDRLKWVEE